MSRGSLKIPKHMAGHTAFAYFKIQKCGKGNQITHCNHLTFQFQTLRQNVALFASSAHEKIQMTFLQEAGFVIWCADRWFPNNATEMDSIQFIAKSPSSTPVLLLWKVDFCCLWSLPALLKMTCQAHAYWGYVRLFCLGQRPSRLMKTLRGLSDILRANQFVAVFWLTWCVLSVKKHVVRSHPRVHCPRLRGGAERWDLPAICGALGNTEDPLGCFSLCLQEKWLMQWWSTWPILTNYRRSYDIS